MRLVEPPKRRDTDELPRPAFKASRGERLLSAVLLVMLVASVLAWCL